MKIVTRCLMAAMPMAGVAVGAWGQPELQIQRPTLEQRQRLERVQLVEPLTPTVAVEPLECLPLESNGVVTVRSAREPAASRVRVYFRRLDAERPSYYFVNARATGPGEHKALLPKPAASGTASTAEYEGRRREIEMRIEQERRVLAERGVQRDDPRYQRLRDAYRELVAGMEPQPVIVWAALIDASGSELARSGESSVPVRAECQTAWYPVRGEELNLTLGETDQSQGPEPPFGFECQGIVTREFGGRLFQDSVCRDYFVAYQPRVVPHMLTNLPVGSADFRNVTVFYGTDRRNVGGSDPAKVYLGGRGPLEVGTCRVTIPVSHEVGELETPGIFERPDPAKHILLVSVDRKPRGTFSGELASRVAQDVRREALVFIHGYNVSFEDAARRTAQMAEDLDFSGAPVMYSWPSQASLGSYPVDEANIRWTVPHLEEFLDLVVQSSGASKVHLIAHSMGNRAVTEVLRRYAERGETAAGGSPRFNEIILVAPDVDADVFRDDIAPRIRATGERVTLYASSNDKALKVSKGVHGHPRAGDLSDGVVLAAGVETIDASNVDTSLLNSIGLGHSYFADKPTVIEDLKRLLSGQPPALRGLAGVQIGARTYWQIR